MTPRRTRRKAGGTTEGPVGGDRRLEFWFEFASTYSYLSAMRIEALAERAGIGLVWRPFLLGPIFAAQGWSTSPFNLFPAKGRYMWRDMERLAAEQGIPFVRPDPFPQNTLPAARTALVGADRAWGPAFVKAAYAAEFGGGRALADPLVLRSILEGLALDADAILAEAEGEANKRRLRAQTEAAASRGLFGAPSFVAPDGEIFWGDDRLERAIAWAAASRHEPGDDVSDAPIGA